MPQLSGPMLSRDVAQATVKDGAVSNGNFDARTLLPIRELDLSWH